MVAPLGVVRLSERVARRALDELYRKQSRATDREERRRHIREFERRLLDEEAHYIYTFTARGSGAGRAVTRSSG
jgi:hypothetical protein